ncbi:voltage-gated hydrogen channel 1 [Callorhinchus milii]|nr:voltage-gated hydrogen channel 1 [Callorhinchus milii]
MAKILKHFSTVGDDYHRWWEEEEEDEHNETVEVTEQPTLPSDFRASLKRLFNSDTFQITIVCLVILDALFVLCELLMDLTIIRTDKDKIAPQVFHYLSITILAFFLLELFGKLYAFRLEFFRHVFEVLDGIIILISFVLDVIYISREDIFDGMGLLILLRLWRVARIINGILVSVKTRAQRKVTKLKNINADLVRKVDVLQAERTEQAQEVERLRRLLQQHWINNQTN